MTYTTVSELANMIDAHNPARLSAPTEPSRVLYAAVEALPEKGRVIRSGRSSQGRPIASAAGASSFERSSIAPEALSMEIAIISPTSVGNRRTAVLSPSVAPFVNASK